MDDIYSFLPLCPDVRKWSIRNIFLQSLSIADGCAVMRTCLILLLPGRSYDLTGSTSGYFRIFENPEVD